MNLNPISPLSGKPLSECDNKEIDAWVALRLGVEHIQYLDELEGWYSWEGDEITPTWKIDLEGFATGGDAPLALMQSDEWPRGWALYKDKSAIDPNGPDLYFIVPLKDWPNAGPITCLHNSPAEAIAYAWLIAKETENE